MVYIYVLLLQDNKYYVGKTNNSDFRYQSHYNLNGSEWTKKYNPINLFEIIPNQDNFDEDKITLQYMSKYGIDNVRGGRYCRITLDDNEIKYIKSSIISATDKCFKCGVSGHFAKQCVNVNNSKLNIINDTLKIKYLDHDININKVQKKGGPKEGHYRIKITNNSYTKTLYHDGGIEDSYKIACDYINTELNKCIVENKLECQRCGRVGHLASACYAKNHINADIGQHINTEEEEEELNICYRCGRDGHWANTCYAKRHVNGYYIKE